MDPWFSLEGALFRSWFPFPDNGHLLEDALNGTRSVCISHNHQDHFDVRALRFALERCPELILQYLVPLTGPNSSRSHPEPKSTMNLTKVNCSVVALGPLKGTTY